MNVKPISFVSIPDAFNSECRIIGAKFRVADLDKTGKTFGAWTDFVAIPFNSHNALLEACKKAYLLLDAENNHGMGKRTDALSYEVYQDLEQAIAKAEGKIPWA